MNAAVGISFFALAVFALLALVVLGGLVAMVANPKTRVLGLVLLLAPVPLVVLGAAAVFWTRASYVPSHPSATVVHDYPTAMPIERPAWVPTPPLPPDVILGPPGSTGGDMAVPRDAVATPLDEVNEQPGAAETPSPPAVDAPTVPAPAAKPEVDPGVIRALGRAISLAIEKPRAAKSRTASKAAEPAADVPPPAPEAAPPIEKPSPVGDPTIEAMVRSLAGAVVEELPADMDELTALKALGHYLGRAIAAEREAMASEDKPAPDAPHEHESDAIAQDPPRPAWVDMPQGRQGDGYQVVVSVGPYSSRLECDRAVPYTLRSAAAEYATYYLGHPTHGRDVLSHEYLREHVLRDEWEEPIVSEMVGPMMRLHLRLVFDRQANEAIKEGWREAEVEERIAISGVCLAAVLGVLGAAFALLKIDAATHGAYRRRAAIVAGVVAVVVVLGFFWLDRPAMEQPKRPRDINTYPTSAVGGYSYDVPMIAQHVPTAAQAPRADEVLLGREILVFVILPLGLVAGGLLGWRFRGHRKWVIAIAAGVLAVVFLVVAMIS
ncbi:MAG: hypothetical protein JW809_01800 [Pirellulales bacterium]|nr:hypothetical protein [Pirellulales bacterium]